MYARIRNLLIVILASAVPTFAGAQHPTPATQGAGPRVESLVTGFRVANQRADSTNTAQRRRAGTAKPVALMLVGGAAFLLGALIGGDVGLLFMIGGAVALLIGLYKYLQ